MHTKSCLKFGLGKLCALAQGQPSGKGSFSEGVNYVPVGMSVQSWGLFLVCTRSRIAVRKQRHTLWTGLPSARPVPEVPLRGTEWGVLTAGALEHFTEGM